MSQIGGGSSASEFDKLIGLAQFVQSPQYSDRVAELRDLEVVAKAATDDATRASADAQAQRRALAAERAKYDSDIAAFKTERDRQNTDMTNREAALKAGLDSLTTRERELERAKTAHEQSVNAYRRHVHDKGEELDRREEAVKRKERTLAQQEAALVTRIARIRAATDE